MWPKTWSANEQEDVLGELGQGRDRGSAFGTSLNNSKWNLKSLSSSENQGCFVGSYSDLENTLVSNSTSDLTAFGKPPDLDHSAVGNGNGNANLRSFNQKQIEDETILKTLVLVEIKTILKYFFLNGRK